MANRISLDTWANLLWNYYLPQIQARDAFFLAADKRLIFELGRSKVDFQDETQAIQDFNLACSELLTFTSSNIELKTTAFAKRPGLTKSRIICLAVQQVLVVENMLSDPNFTQNAYFPRYRELLGLVDAARAVSPLRSDEFQSIWSHLKKEILDVPGAQPSCITFAPGLIRQELNRQLPMSQALFTTNDLQRIYEKLGVIEDWSDASTSKHRLIRIKGFLGQRAQRIILAYDTLAFKQLCDQLSSFMKNPTRRSHLRIWRREYSANNELVAFLDSEDAFEDIFTVHISEKIHEEISLVELRNIVVEKCSDDRFLLMSVKHDRYLEMESQEALSEGDSIVLILLTSQKEKLSGVCSKNGIEWNTTFNVAKSNLPEGIEVHRADNLTNELATKITSLIAPESGRSQGSRFRLSGGLLADGRTKTYLLGYPPDSIQYEGTKLDGETLIQVNQTEISVAAFLNSLKEQNRDKSYYIEYRGDNTNLLLSVRNPLKEVHKFGYLFDSQRISPISSELINQESYFSGMSLTSRPSLEPVLEGLARKTIAFMLSGKGDEVLGGDRDWLIARVQQSAVPKGIVRLLISKILGGNILLTPGLRREIQLRKAAKNR